METSRTKGIVAVANGEKHDDHPGNNQTRNTNFPRVREDYKTQVSEEIEGRVTNKLSPEFSQTECRFL